MDKVECEALGRTPKDALRSGLRCSLEPLTALVDGKPAAMMGAVPVSMLDGIGRVWMLGTDRVYDRGRDLLLYGPLILEHWLATFRRLENVVAADNRRAIRLLLRWGCEVGTEEQDYGGIAFLPFHIERTAIQAPALAA